MQNKSEYQDMIEAAVSEALDAGADYSTDEVRAALNLGVTIGAATASQIGAEIGAKTAMKAAEREVKTARKKQVDKRLGDTKLLLKNYRSLQEYYENAVFDIDAAEAADEDFESLMQSIDSRVADERLIVESIQRNYITTKIIMTHVNKMLTCYRYMCERSGRTDDMRHWRVLERMYLDGTATTVDDIADREHVDKRTVYRDIDVCVADLAVLFFGVGGLDRG